MTLPLMFGFTLPFLDQYFAGFYASHGVGDITRLANAKQLFTAPMVMLSQASGVASMPFFAQLWARQERYKFATGVADSVSRIVALSVLVTSLMIALAHPSVDLIFGGGRFTPADVNLTTLFFALYAISIFAWSAQAIYARGFYAAGITWLPMLASTIILFVAFPLYALGYKFLGAGAWPCLRRGHLLQAPALAVLLHKRRMVSLADLDYAELGRCFVAGAASCVAIRLLVWGLGGLVDRLPAALFHGQARLIDLIVLLVCGSVWFFITKWILEKSDPHCPA